MIYAYHKSDELYHHGILGQQWGKKNGPPYPLDASDHSAAERKAGYQNSISNTVKSISDKTSIDKETQNKISKETRAKIAKGILIGAAVVGIGVATGLALRNYQIKTFEAAGMVNKKTTPADIVNKSHITFDMANKLIEVRGDKDSINLIDEKAANAINKAVMKDFKLVFHENSDLARVHFGDNFSIDKARDAIFATPAKKDNELYQKIIPNFSDPHGNTEKYNYILKANGEISAPSVREMNRILTKMYKENPEFRKDVVDALSEMLNNRKLNDRGFITGSDKKINRLKAEISVLSDKNFSAIWALGASSEKIDSQIADKFAKKGYNAIMDIHDIEKGMKMPVIILDKYRLRVHDKNVANS